MLVAGAAVVTLAAGNIGKYSPLAKWLDDKFVGQYDYDQEVQLAKNYLKERYHIDLKMGLDKDEPSLVGDPITVEKYKQALQILVRELSKYPPEMIHKLAEGRGFHIYIVRNLLDKSVPVGSEANYLGGDVPPFRAEKGRQLVLNADNWELQQAIHHELNHDFVGLFENREAHDARWIQLHEKLKKNPYRPVPRNVVSNEPAPEHYFLTNYAGSAPIEDEAVCAEWMMTPSLAVQFLDKWRNERDPVIKDILAAKWNKVKKNYYDWSDGKVGDALWQSIIDEGEKERAGNKGTS